MHKYIFLLILILITSYINSAEPNYWIDQKSEDLEVDVESGTVTMVTGNPSLKKIDINQKEYLQPLLNFDELNIGDEIVLTKQSLLEIVSGRNCRIIIGENSLVTLLGVKIIPGKKNNLNRNDLYLNNGLLRARVALNVDVQEFIMIITNNLQVLLLQGDVIVTTSKNRTNVYVIEGEADIKIGSGKSIIGSTKIEKGQMYSNGKVGAIDKALVKELKDKLKFSTETIMDSLPLKPIVDPDMDAP